MPVEDRYRDRFLAMRREAAEARGAGPPPVGGGGPPHDPDMEARVAKLENALQGINVTLARMDERLGHLATAASLESLRADVATLAGKLDGKASAIDLAELKGRVGRITTVPVLASMLTILALVAAAWPWIKQHLIGG